MKVNTVFWKMNLSLVVFMLSVSLVAQTNHSNTTPGNGVHGEGGVVGENGHTVGSRVDRVDSHIVRDGGDPMRTLIHDMRFEAAKSIDAYEESVQPSGSRLIKIFLEKHGSDLSYFVLESTHDFSYRRNDIHGFCGMVYPNDRSTVYFSLAACRSSFAMLDSVEKKEYISKFLIHEAVHHFDDQFLSEYPHHDFHDYEKFANEVARTVYLNALAQNQREDLVVHPVPVLDCDQSSYIDPTCDVVQFKQLNLNYIALSYVEGRSTYWSAGNSVQEAGRHIQTVCNGLNPTERARCKQNYRVDSQCLSFAIKRQPRGDHMFVIERGDNFRQAQVAAKSSCINKYGSCYVDATYCAN